MFTKTNWLEHLKIVTDILDVFWESRIKTDIDKADKKLHPVDIIGLSNANILDKDEARALLKELGVTLKEK